jgi:hypothetical protein
MRKTGVRGLSANFANFREFFGRVKSNFERPTSNPAIQSRFPRFIEACEQFEQL